MFPFELVERLVATGMKADEEYESLGLEKEAELVERASQLA